MRSVVAVAVAVVATAAGAVIVGEYDLEGITALMAACLFGVFLAELVASIARRGDPYLMAATALLTEAGLVWALWISTGHRLDLARWDAWAATLVGSAAAAAWLRAAGTRGRRSPTAT